jgi:hypothetical protein
MGRIAARVLAGLLAVASAAPILIALFLALFNVGVSAQQPDPTVPDGDPCCGHPGTWARLRSDSCRPRCSCWGAGAVAYLAIQLGRYAVSARAATSRQWRRAATAVVYLGLVLALTVIESESS